MRWWNVEGLVSASTNVAAGPPRVREKDGPPPRCVLVPVRRVESGQGLGWSEVSRPSRHVRPTPGSDGLPSLDPGALVRYGPLLTSYGGDAITGALGGQGNVSPYLLNAALTAGFGRVGLVRARSNARIT